MTRCNSRVKRTEKNQWMGSQNNKHYWFWTAEKKWTDIKQIKSLDITQDLVFVSLVSRRGERVGLKKTVKAVMSKNFPNFINPDSRISINPNEDKFKEMYTKTHYSQTFKNRRQNVLEVMRETWHITSRGRTIQISIRNDQKGVASSDHNL